MSDMRFILIGIALVFVGFIILGVLGENYRTATFEAEEFGTCYEYFKDRSPVEINCSYKIFDQILFFVLVVGFVGSGIVAIIKGIKGDWDNKTKPEDMVGPRNNQNENSDNSDKD